MHNCYIPIMNFNTQLDQTKEQIFSEIRSYLTAEGFIIAIEDQSRPWGGFFVVDESQSKQFIETYFENIPQANTTEFEKISPKILVVQPNTRLSWQYHHRRAEVWKVIGGKAGVVTSPTDEQPPVQEKLLEEIIILKQGSRHRLVGLDQWGIIAEIWQHTDKNNPSNEEDIVRIEDDFGR